MPLPDLESARREISLSLDVVPAEGAPEPGPARYGAVVPPDSADTDLHALILTLRHALIWGSGSSEQWAALGEALLTDGRHAAAEDAFRKALCGGPCNLTARLHLARLLCREGYCLEAATLCWDALAEDRNNAVLSDALAGALAKAGLSRRTDKSAGDAAAHAEPDLKFWHVNRSVAVQLPCKTRLQQTGTPSCRADNELLLRWNARLSSWPGIKVGLAWSAQGDDALLGSIPLAQFAPLANIPGLVFFCLQPSSTGEAMYPPVGMELVNLADILSSPADLDAALMQMDLVISVESALTKRAAALGRLVWQLQPAHRSLADGAGSSSDCPRFFQQKQRGQWEPLMYETACALLELMNTHATSEKLDETQKRLLQARIAIQEYRLPEAERTYRELLATQAPTRRLIDALRLYVDHTGRYHIVDSVLVSIGGAHRDVLDWLVDLRAHALMKQGKQDDAFTLWDRATNGVLPRLPVLIHYAEAAHARRDWERAASLWEKAMTLYPSAPQAALGAAFTYAESGDPEKAITCFYRGLAMAPVHPMAHHRLGCLLRAKGEKEQALRHMQKALYLDPGHASGWEHLGHLFYQIKNYRAAATCFEQAVLIHPTVYAHSHLGFCAYLLDEPGAAIASFDQALQLKPKGTEVLYFKAMCLDQLQHHDAAVDTMEKLRALDPQSFDRDDTRRKNLFLMHLKLRSSGVIRSTLHVGWSARRFQNERWTGQPLQGKTLLVYQDSGFGDSIQAARFYRCIKQEFAPAKIKLAVWPELMRLYKGLADVDEILSIYADGINNTPCDYYVDEYSLFLVLGRVRWSCMPGAYLHAESESVDKWRRSFNDDRAFRIGLAWTGNPAHPNDTHRSTRLEDWAPLADIPGLSIYAVQKGNAVDQAFDTPALNMVTPGNALHDFADTAALMTALDLVISVDSAPAHLAGALDMPVWLILPATGVDWRWHGQDDLPFWYSGLRLFRQGKEQDRHEVILRMRDELRLLVAQHRSRLQSTT